MATRIRIIEVETDEATLIDSVLAKIAPTVPQLTAAQEADAGIATTTSTASSI